MNPDFAEFLAALLDQEARFLVVGAHALAVHGVPRATGDIDIWVERSADNVGRVWRALEAFGAPTTALGVRGSDLETPDVVVQIGLPPRRIDILTGVSGLDFADAWTSRVTHRVGELGVPSPAALAVLVEHAAAGRSDDRAAGGLRHRPGTRAPTSERPNSGCGHCRSPPHRAVAANGNAAGP